MRQAKGPEPGFQRGCNRDSVEAGQGRLADCDAIIV